ncbi:hypothetical protein ACX80P_12985, partial [Arthrobacter sp. TMS1-12-1]
MRCMNKLETMDSGRVLVNGHLVGYEERRGGGGGGAPG